MASQRQEERVSTAKARGSRDDDSLGARKSAGTRGLGGGNRTLLRTALPGNFGGRPPVTSSLDQAGHRPQLLSIMGRELLIGCPACLQNLRYLAPHLLGVSLSLDVPDEFIVLFLGFMDSG